MAEEGGKSWTAGHRALVRLETGRAWPRKGADAGVSLHTHVAAHPELSATVALSSSALLSLNPPLFRAVLALLCTHGSQSNPDHLHHQHCSTGSAAFRIGSPQTCLPGTSCYFLAICCYFSSFHPRPSERMVKLRSLIEWRHSTG